MAYYLVRAKAQNDLQSLKADLDQGEIALMRPFGSALDYSLRNARLDAEGWAVWEEEDYCHPPLAMERAAVLDRYFRDLSALKVELGDGWKQIDQLPSLWKG
jgi:hypothetical protein